jgi:hypothetical protein
MRGGGRTGNWAGTGSGKARCERGTILGDHREDSLGWSRAVEDVDWVLQQL